MSKAFRKSTKAAPVINLLSILNRISSVTRVNATFVDKYGRKPNCSEVISASHEQLKELAERINQAFLSPMAFLSPSFATLPSRQEDPLQIEVSALEDVCTENSVFLQLLHLKPSKAPGPDGLPTWIFKENADVLSKPV